jgi:hypothetical protein
MTKIDYLSIVTSLSTKALNIINEFIQTVEQNPIEETMEKFIPGIEHQRNVDNINISLRIYYSKDKKKIDKITFKVYGEN